MKASELNEFSDDELAAKLSGFKEKYFKLRFQHATAQLDSPAELKKVRRSIARAETIITARKKKVATAATA